MEHPERNGETVSIFHFTDKKHDRKLHNGFSIQLSVDPRDAYADGLYQAYLLPGPNPYILIKVPGQCASFRLDHELLLAKEASSSCPRVQEAVDLHRNAVESDGKRVAKHILLKFPEYMTLSNDIYSPDSTSGRIDEKITLYSLKTVLHAGGKQISMIMCRLAWKVHIVERNVRAVEAAKPQGKSRQQKMTEQLAGMEL